MLVVFIQTILFINKMSSNDSVISGNSSNSSITHEESINETCPICFDDIKKINVCTTPCGHTFCFKCLTKAMNNNTECPMCRGTLVDDEDIVSSDDDDDDDDDEYETEDEMEEEEVNVKMSNIEIVVERFTNKGYNLMDALMILREQFSNKTQEKNQKHLEKITDEFETMMGELEDEIDEAYEMQKEDKEMYRPVAVVATTTEPEPEPVLT